MSGILVDATIKASSALALEAGYITPEMRARMVDGRVSTFDLNLATELASGERGGNGAKLLGGPLRAAIEKKLASETRLDRAIEAIKDVFPVLFERIRE